MKLSEEQVEKIEDFCTDYDYTFYGSYSGRGMYGETCVGFVTDSLFCLGKDFSTYFANDEELLDLFSDPWLDNMGNSTIAYFKHVQS